MDTKQLYDILDIDDASEFIYYENVAALLEADEMIDQDLIEELLSEMDTGDFLELIESYFNEFLSKLPDNMDDLYLTVDNIRRVFAGCSDVIEIAEMVTKFRKWYVHDMLVLDMNTSEELCIRDARYNISASEYTGEECRYDMSLAYDFEFDGYDMLLGNIIIDEDEDALDE